MGLGYQGYVKFKGNYCLATSGNVNVTRQIISADGGYGGGLAGSQMATGSPHFYEPWKTNMSASFDLTESVVKPITQLLNNRDQTFDAEYSFDGVSVTGIKDIYWTGLGFGASVGGLATGNLSGVSFKKHEIVCDGFSQMKNGKWNFCDKDSLIAYWETSINLASECCHEWGLNITQDVNPIYCCKERGKDPIDPDYVLLGEVDIELTAADYSALPAPETTSVTLKVGNSSLSFGKAELINNVGNLATGDSPPTCTVTYKAYRYG